MWEKLGKDFQRIFEPKKRTSFYKEYMTRDEQHKAFWTEKAKVIVCDRIIFDYYREFLSNVVDTTDLVVIHKLPFKKLQARVFFRNEALRDEFNEELQKFRDTGLYDRLLQTHLRVHKTTRELLAGHNVK